MVVMTWAEEGSAAHHHRLHFQQSRKRNRKDSRLISRPVPSTSLPYLAAQQMEHGIQRSQHAPLRPIPAEHAGPIGELLCWACFWGAIWGTAGGAAWLAGQAVQFIFGPNSWTAQFILGGLVLLGSALGLLLSLERFRIAGSLATRYRAGILRHSRLLLLGFGIAFGYWWATTRAEMSDEVKEARAAVVLCSVSPVCAAQLLEARGYGYRLPAILSR